MSIKKKLIHFKNRENFDREVVNNAVMLSSGVTILIL